MDDENRPYVGKKFAESPFQFGAIAKVRTTPLTLGMGLGERIGTVHGQTTPSRSGVEVLGDVSDDYAVNVYFGDSRSDFWFAEQLLELVEPAPKMNVSVRDGKIVVETVAPSAVADEAG